MYREALEPFGGAGGTCTGWDRVGGRHQLFDMTDVKTVVLDLGAGAEPGDSVPPA